MIHKEKTELARANMLKVIRTAVRLKHSLAADAELNEVLPLAEARFNASVHRNVLPDPINIKKALGI